MIDPNLIPLVATDALLWAFVGYVALTYRKAMKAAQPPESWRDTILRMEAEEAESNRRKLAEQVRRARASHYAYSHIQRAQRAATEKALRLAVGK